MNSVFWPPTTPEQIAAFTRYVKWMVNHFRGRIHYYALWNEQDIGYWNPWGDPEAVWTLAGCVHSGGARYRSASQGDLRRPGGSHPAALQSARSMNASAPRGSTYSRIIHIPDTGRI